MCYKNDAYIAKALVEGSYNDIIYNFSEHSAIYKMTNEDLTKYKKYLYRRNNVLSVIGSGDQILNSILYGAKNIDGFDISIFPKYFLKLKIAAVKSLSLEDYIKYFIETSDYYDEFNIALYAKIRENLDEDALFFWDLLYSNFQGHYIYNSSLFAAEPVDFETSVKKNDYLNPVNYEILKRKLNSVIINHVSNDNLSIEKDKDFSVINVYDISVNDLNKLVNEYNLINLSNILSYNREKSSEILEKLPLSNCGIALGYLYNKSDHFNKNFRLDNFDNKEADTIYVYKKQRNVN